MTDPTAAPPADADAPLDGASWRLIAFLSIATLFEGFDFFALAQVLPQIRDAFDLTEFGTGALVAFASLGTMGAWGVVRMSDQIGRRRVLLWTLVGYAVFTGLSAIAPNVWFLALAQFGARLFLIAEWGVAAVYAAEAFPARHRGTMLGVVQAASSLGSIVCGATVPFLLQSPLGWRTVFLVGVVPGLLLALARRGLPETKRFAALGARPPSDLLRPWKAGHGRRILQLALLWSLTYVCTQSAVHFWKEFAVRERGFTDAMVGGSITIAAVGSTPFLFLAGRLLDRLGRRAGATVIYAVAIGGVLGAYLLPERIGLTIALAFSIFGASAVLPVLNAFTTELFPTDLRAEGLGWANNLLGRIGYVLGPLAVGAAAGSIGWGPAVAITAIGPALALVGIWAWMPETAGRELEDTAVH